MRASTFFAADRLCTHMITSWPGGGCHCRSAPPAAPKGSAPYHRHIIVQPDAGRNVPRYIDAEVNSVTQRSRGNAAKCRCGRSIGTPFHFTTILKSSMEQPEYNPTCCALHDNSPCPQESLIARFLGLKIPAPSHWQPRW